MKTATALAACVAAIGMAMAADNTFELSSPDFAARGTLRDAQVFNAFGCTGKNLSPALEWRGAPAGTRSFALMVHDPDAPTGSGWWHWVVYNLPANATSLAAGAGSSDGKKLPPGAAQGLTDYGARGYGGPCPPPGPPHRYFFRLHALNVDKLDIPPDATAALVGFNVNANTIAIAELVGMYGR